jgi:predicted acylesterase/phospholipase RssA
MQRIGLALSGGGFRATLFHLGMVRLLREANVLPAVTHITSVSGGSILAAHLLLHWHRYTGSLEDFDAAAAELIRFVQFDVRNRVVRRYPLAMPLRALRRLALLGPSRRLTRTGLLEYHSCRWTNCSAVSPRRTTPRRDWRTCTCSAVCRSKKRARC